MTRHDAFEADLFSVFDDDAQAPIPAGGLERLEAAIANRQPRPARLAGLGGRWIGDPSAGHRTAWRAAGRVPVLRLSGAVLLLLLTLALIGTAALIGGRLLDARWIRRSSSTGSTATSSWRTRMGQPDPGRRRCWLVLAGRPLGARWPPLPVLRHDSDDDRHPRCRRCRGRVPS